jgi:hypothetical protein
MSGKITTGSKKEIEVILRDKEATYKNSKKYFNAAEKELTKTDKNEFHFLNKALLSSKKQNILNIDSEDKLKELKYLDKNLDSFYLITKLRQANFLIKEATHLNVDYSTSFINELVTALEKKASLIDGNPLLDIHYQCFNFLTKEAKGLITLNIIKTLNKHFDTIPLKDIHKVLMIISPFVWNKYLNYDDKYLTKAFEIYEKVEASKNKKAPIQYFQPAVSFGLAKDKLEWTKKVIESIKQRVSNKNQKNAYNLYYGTYYYYIKNFKKSITTLNKINDKNVFGLLAMTMKVRVAFEKEDEDLLNYLSNQFLHTLTASSLYKPHIVEMFVLFNNNIKFLLKAKLATDSKKREKLLSKLAIKKENFITFNERWIFEQYQQITE